MRASAAPRPPLTPRLEGASNELWRHPLRPDAEGLRNKPACVPTRPRAYGLASTWGLAGAGALQEAGPQEDEAQLSSPRDTACYVTCVLC